MCVTVLYAEGAGLIKQGKALASAVVVLFPPERSSLSLHTHTHALSLPEEEAFRSTRHVREQELRRRK